MIRLRLLALCAAVALSAGACSTDFPTTSSDLPPIVTITEPEFTGTLNVNGAVTYPFILTTSGIITVTVMGIEPSHDNTVRIGLQLGTWNGTSCVVGIPQMSNERAFISTVITAQATPSAYCVRVFDAGQGGLPEPVTFDVQIQHP